MKNWWFKRIAGGILFVAAAVLVFGFVVMTIWNWLIPALFSAAVPITFIQAIGLLVLSKLLFGGFGRGWGRHRHGGMWRHRMMRKFQNMSPEQKEKYKERFCRDWGASTSGEFTKDQPDEVAKV